MLGLKLNHVSKRGHWGFKLSTLIKLQKMAIRTKTLNKYNADTDPQFKQLNLLKSKQSVEIKFIKIVLKIWESDIPYHNAQNVLIKYKNSNYNIGQKVCISMFFFIFEYACSQNYRILYVRNVYVNGVAFIIAAHLCHIMFWSPNTTCSTCYLCVLYLLYSLSNKHFCVQF